MNDGVPKSIAHIADATAFPTLNVLVCQTAARAHHRPTIVSPNEIFCGPDCRDERGRDGRVLGVRTPEGAYDLAAIVAQLPAAQRPQLIVVKADAGGRNFPANLGAIGCPTVLIAGNTQHLVAPIARLLAYAERERFTAITSDHKRHHLHFFVEAGLPRVFWLPGFHINPRRRPWRTQRRHPVLFVGQTGQWHPWRTTVLEGLARAGFPVTVREAPQAEAAALYADAQISLNVSLNGDLNLRVFEVLSSGGFLLTDRLAPEAGLDLIFRDGEHLVTFSDERDLAEKVAHYLAHPAEALAIARAGHAAFWDHHRPEQKAWTLVDAVFRETIPEPYRIERDPRAARGPAPSRARLAERIGLYQLVQDLHLRLPAPRILCEGRTPVDLLGDLVDLPRLQLYIEGCADAIDPATRAAWTEMGLLPRLRFTTDENAGGPWDAVIA